MPLPSGLLPSGLPTKMLSAPLTSVMRATCPVHLILLTLITLIILGDVQLLIVQFSPTSCHLIPLRSKYNILLSTLFSNTLNLQSAKAVFCTLSIVYISVAQPFYTHGTLNIVEESWPTPFILHIAGGGGDGCVSFQFHLVDLVCPTIIKKMKTETEQKTR
jgi:hypothetical protein